MCIIQLLKVTNNRERDATRAQGCVVRDEALTADVLLDPLDEWVKLVRGKDEDAAVWSHRIIVLHPTSAQPRVAFRLHAELKSTIRLLKKFIKLSFTFISILL